MIPPELEESFPTVTGLFPELPSPRRCQDCGKFMFRRVLLAHGGHIFINRKDVFVCLGCGREETT